MTTPGPAEGILQRLAGTGGQAAQFFMWGVLYGLVQQVMGPTFVEVGNVVNAKNPTTPLTPAEAATAALKGWLTYPNAEAEAAKSGIDAGRFATMYRMTGEPPSLQEMLSLYRRGDATEEQLHQTVKESAVRDEWWQNGIIQKLGKIPPSPLDFLQAHLEGQVSPADAKALYEIYGGIVQHGQYNIYDILYNTRGQAPTPTEALDLLNRGIIQERGTGPNSTSYEQAFLEGPWRNKWLDPFLALRRYLPPPRTITTLISHGAITDQYALELFQLNGLSAKDAAIYVQEAHSTGVAKQKDLAVSEIETLYFDQAISRTEATKFLENLGYSSGDSNFILTIQDLRRERKFLESAISRIKTLYTDHKLDKSSAVGALSQFKVPSAQISNLIQTWTLERAANIPHLTESQVAAAFYYQAMTQDEAMTALQKLGYSPYDSWVILSNRVHGPLPGKPEPNAQNPYMSPS